jgi:hypothetical protein
MSATTDYNNESSLDDVSVAYMRLRDIGITKSGNDKLEGDDALRWFVALDKMTNAVKMVRKYASRNPPEIQVQLQLHWYNQFKAADEGQNLYRPIPEQELTKQLLSKEAELKKYKQALTENTPLKTASQIQKEEIHKSDIEDLYGMLKYESRSRAALADRVTLIEERLGISNIANGENP